MLNSRYIAIVLILGLCVGAGKAAGCAARGRFPNDDAENCRGYTMCLLGGPMNYTQYKLTCPLGFVYSHLEEQCTNATSYQCLPNYQCNSTGYYEYKTEDCKSYISCIAGLDEIVTARLIECPIGELFNPNLNVCVNNTSYECNKTIMSNVDIPQDNATDSGIVNFSTNNAVCLNKRFFLLAIGLALISLVYLD